METRGSNKLGLYLITLVIELITGVFRLLFVIPLLVLGIIIVELILSQLGIQLFDVYQVNVDPQYAKNLLWLLLGISLIITYANIIASIVAYLGAGGGSLMTRFVLGAREPSTRERETIMQVFEQMAEGVDFPIRSYSKLYVIDAVMDFANLVGTTLYVSSSAFRGNNLQALISHEFGHLNNGDGSLILALRRLVFPPFSLFIGGIRDFSTNRPAYRPAVKEFDAIQIFYSMINNIIFFTLAFIGGGIGVWVMSWAWAGYFRARDYVADSFAAGLGYRDLLVNYLEANIYFDTSIPYMLGWHPAAELRIDALQHPDLYGLPVYDDIPAAAAAAAGFTPLSDVEPAGEGVNSAPQGSDPNTQRKKRVRNILNIVVTVFTIYALYRAWPSIQAKATGAGQSLSSSVSNQYEELKETFAFDTPTPEPVTTPTPEAAIVAGLTECPLLGGTRKDEVMNWEISVPDGEIAFISTQEFDEQEGGVFVTITGPYEGVHRVKDASYCGEIPTTADYSQIQKQQMALLAEPYEQVLLSGLESASSEPYDCSATASASRDLKQHGTGDNCWLKLTDGATAEIAFNDEAQVTFRTNSGGNGVYFYIADPGDRLKNVIGATIRPIPFVQSTYGGLAEVKDFEIDYHSPGGHWVTCLRDANNDNKALNSECGNETGTGTPLMSRAEMLVDFNAIYNQQGWCSLWARMVNDGLVKGDCPSAVLEWGYEDISTANGTQNLLTGLQMRATGDVEVYYPTCATFGSADYTGGKIEPWIHNDNIATDITLHRDSVFSIFFRCDNAWSPPADEDSLGLLLGDAVLAQIKKLGYDTADDFAEAWGLRIGTDMVNGEVAPSEISTCPGELNGCVQIVREKNANGAIEFGFYAKNPKSCRRDGYRREPGEDGQQTGVPPNFEGLLEGVTIRNCQETSTSEVAIEASNPEIYLSDWVVCWHGRSGYEFLIAYPESEARSGVDLADKVTRKPWDDQDEDLANDSLKMCYYDGDWHGSPNPAWFPTASYLQLQEGKFVVCEHSPGCGGNQWQISPGAPAPMQINDLVTEPPQNGIQLLTYWPS